MPKQLLKLFYGHPFIYRHRCKCPAELVWMDLGDSEPLSNLSESLFHSTNPHPFVRTIQRDKQRWIIVCSISQIGLQMQKL